VVEKELGKLSGVPAVRGSPDTVVTYELALTVTIWLCLSVKSHKIGCEQNRPEERPYK